MSQKFQRLSDVPAEAIDWLWPGRIPLGSLTIVEGDPGQGKSTFCYDLAARLTTGRPMPGEDAGRPVAGAVFLQSEDDVNATMQPRLKTAGANLEKIRVHSNSEPGQPAILLPDDINDLENEIVDASAKMVVIDPVSAFLSGNITSDRFVRQCMGELASLAKRRSLAIILIRHLTKSRSSNQLYSGSGSVALAAAARSVLRVVADSGSDDRFQRYVISIKNNLSVVPAYGYRTTLVGDSTMIEWTGPNADFALEDAQDAATSLTRVEEAMEVIYSILADGPVWSKTVRKLAKEAGVKDRTLDRAKKRMGVRSITVGRGDTTARHWKLPDGNRLVRQMRELELDRLMDDLLHGKS